MAVWNPPKHIDLDKLREAMAENEKIRDAHEVGYREGFEKGIDRKPMAERRERIAMAAMQGILSDRSGHGRHESFHIREVAGAVLVVADELIALLDAAADKDGGS